MSTKETLPETCLICGKAVPDYVPKFCCSGIDCGCHGQPLDPCVCSQECYDAVIKGIGKPFEQRRADYINSLRTRLDAAEKELEEFHKGVRLADEIITKLKNDISTLNSLKQANAELVKDKERLDFIIKLINDYGTKGIEVMPWTVIEANGEDSEITFDRQTIDAAVTKGGA